MKSLRVSQVARAENFLHDDDDEEGFRDEPSILKQAKITSSKHNSKKNARNSSSSSKRGT